MKKILVPTDFTQQAENALVFAHQIGLKTNATIELLHILDTIQGEQYANLGNLNVTGEVRGIGGGMDDVYFIKLVEKAREQLNELVKRPEFSGVEINYTIQAGSPYKRIYEKTTSKKYDAVICLGAVIRGGTPHFDYISAEVSKGVAQVGLESGLPVIFGVLTTDTIEQALERAGTKAGNKGWDAALSAIEMVNLFGKI